LKKLLNKDLFLFTFVGLMIGALFFVGTLFYADDFSLIGLINAGTMSTILLFALGWFMIVANEGSLDILIYGVQAFAKAIVGKRMKNSFYDYTTEKTRTSKGTFFGFWLSSLIYLIPTVILSIVYYSN
jgi:hypothetical protein